MRQLLVEAGYRSSGLGNLLKKQKFDNFSLHFYNGEDKEAAETALSVAKKFAADFDKTHASLLFVGGTGLGKTHLSSAIAKTVIDRGYDVLYTSAVNMLSEFERVKFRGEQDETDRYFLAELLIIDDLGAEFISQFSVSALYNLINTRQNKGRSTIISTNWTIAAITAIKRMNERKLRSTPSTKASALST